jgi:acetyl-CoA acyltransferase
VLFYCLLSTFQEQVPCRKPSSSPPFARPWAAPPKALSPPPAPTTSPQLALSGALDRFRALDKAEIDDVILGCAQPEGEQGWNIARMGALRAGLPVEIPGVTVNRLCASGLEAIALADQRIRSGGARSSSPAAPSP